MWESKNAIRRDLEKVSRGRIPIDIDYSCLRNDAKPPAFSMEEETEEEFYRRHCSGDPNFNSPDLKNIKDLIYMVHGDRAPYEGNVQLEVSKLNVQAPEFCPNNIKDTEKNNNSTKGEKDNVFNVHDQNTLEKQEKLRPLANKRSIFNVAINSILKNKENILQNNKNTERKTIKLATPHDFSTQIKKESHEKDVLKIEQTSNAIDKVVEESFKPSSPFFCGTSMFKRRTPKPTQEVKKPIEKVEVRLPHKSTYVPSAFAEQYLNRCIKNSAMREVVTEDIWSRAERQMRAIDEARKKAEEERLEQLREEKRLAEELRQIESDKVNLFKYLPGFVDDNEDTYSELSGGTSRPQSTMSDFTNGGGSKQIDDPKEPYLKEHRHLLGAECAVCKLIAKYNVQTECLNFN